MESASEAYDRIAPIYDAFNAANNYEVWLGQRILPELVRHGLEGDTVLDVGCGTGQAFQPLLDRGWRIWGCDISQQMLLEARRKFGSRVQLFRSDARSLTLPSGFAGPSQFQLIMLLNDVINYLTEDGDLERAFASVRRYLSRDGLAVFDANTLSLLRTLFGSTDRSTEGWQWEGLANRVEFEGTYEARLSGPCIETHVHRERHWGRSQVESALQAAHLRPLAALGLREDDGSILLDEGPDEERHTKTIFIVAHA